MSCVFLGMFLSYATSNFILWLLFLPLFLWACVFSIVMLICCPPWAHVFLLWVLFYRSDCFFFNAWGNIWKNSICSVAKIFWYRLFTCHLFHRYLLSCVITQRSYTNSHTETQLWIRYFLAWIFAQCHCGSEKIIFQGNEDFPYNPGLYT